MSFHEAIIMLKFNLKDIVIMLEMLIIAVIYFTGSLVTVRQPRTVKAVAKKVLNGALYTEFAVALLWVFFAIQI